MIYLITYSTYILVSIFITVIVGNKLYRDGGIWTSSLFEDTRFSERVNNLLLLGYYLVNIGFIFYAFTSSRELNTWADSIQNLSKKIGMILLLLGYLHYQNIIIIYTFFTFKHLKKWDL